jgi:hypothetical protein
LAQSEGAGRDGELTREANTAIWGGAACSDNGAGGFGHRRARIALNAASYQVRQLLQGRNHGKHVVRVGVRVWGLRWLGWT